MSALRYVTALTIPAAVAASIYFGGWLAPLALVVSFVIFPAIELFWRGSERNLSEEEEATVLSQRRYDYVVYAMVPVQYALLAWFLIRVAGGAYGGWELIGVTASMGVACGVLGINVAHDLGHSRRQSEQNMARLLLLTTLYQHFFIEHNRGHHARVATDEDPATSRRGEWLYAFLPRTVVGSYLDAWRLESRRLSQKGGRVLSWSNQMLRFQVYQVAFVALIAAVFGALATAMFVGASVFGIVLLESVNYVEHYGLRRERRADGRFERVLPAHSWNSNHPIGRAVLFELTRHSDHHANARRPYAVLRHFDESPQLPTGYPGMVVWALVPPLYFAVMHPLLDGIEHTMPVATEAGAA